MRSSYKILFSVSLRHAFFGEGYPDCFRVIPAEETKSTLLKAGCIFRNTAAGFNVAYDVYRSGNARSREAVLAEVHDMIFFITASDPYLFNYTDALYRFSPDERIAYFTNRKDTPGILHYGPSVSGDDMVGRGLLRGISFPKQSVGFIRVKCNRPVSEQFEIKFGSRSSYWRYVLLSEHLASMAKPAILCRDGDYEFVRGNDITLPDNRTAKCFFSTKSVEMKAAHRHSIFLVEGYDGDTGRYKIVLETLPSPSRTSLVISEPVKGQGEKAVSEDRLYSQIFI